MLPEDWNSYTVYCGIWSDTATTQSNTSKIMLKKMIKNDLKKSSTGLPFVSCILLTQDNLRTTSKMCKVRRHIHQMEIVPGVLCCASFLSFCPPKWAGSGSLFFLGFLFLLFLRRCWYYIFYSATRLWSIGSIYMLCCFS